MTDTMRAAQKVLLMPELVAEILFWLSGTLRKNPNFKLWWASNDSRHGEAARYLTVNRVFFTEGIRVIGKMPLACYNIDTRKNVPLLDRFAVVKSLPRAKFYASSVEFGRVTSVRHSKMEKANAAFDQLVFSKLVVLDLRINNYVEILNIPLMHAPVLKTLHVSFDPKADPWNTEEDYLSSHNAGRIAEWIQACLPALEKVVFYNELPKEALTTMSGLLGSVKVEKPFLFITPPRRPGPPSMLGVRIPPWVFRVVKYHTGVRGE
ncbi:hypothetical protein N7520_004126 [Penicillium odoratum]|uniref:uncharacterized protein n=1 Tax=Penicillium odoratum TaxID=1167516 RepID=UPI002549824C|nr:uncharacterized protein N7520_004126 [Penicillium odoratum]KAJ5769567.1 hypothetical protein N7520_004126 [Penicillium odoratum]